MLDVGALKCAFFYALKIFREIKMIDVSLVNYDSIVEIRVKISSFGGLSKVDYTYRKRSQSKGT